MTLIDPADTLTRPDLALYGGTDPRDQPLYTYPEAARATGIPVSTLRAWTVGQRYRRMHDVGFFEPVISRPAGDDPRLSFTNLVEAHVLRALRTVHEVQLKSVREAVDIAQREFGVQRLLTSRDLRASAGQLFLDRYTGLLELSEAKQLAMRALLEQFLERVEFDESRLPHELRPFPIMPRNTNREVITLSPYVSFGRALVRRIGVSTRAIVQRLEANEPVEEVQRDYGLTLNEIEEAIVYEAAA